MAYEHASNQRKKMIASKFKELLCIKPLSQISVSELARLCGINRKTFYYHFEDINALLNWTMEQETIKVICRYDMLSDFDRVVGHVADYMDKNHAMLYNIYNSGGGNQLRQFFFENFRILMESGIREIVKTEGYRISDEYQMFLVNFYTEGLVGSIISQISKPRRYQKETLIAYIFITFHRGILKALQDAHENRL